MITTEKMEGTILLDGLIEGRMSDPQVEEALAKWVSFVNSLGLKFNLDAGNGAFSILPDNQAVPCAKLGPAPEDGIRQAIEQLIKVLPEEDRGSVFSTLRSSEFRHNEEVQTLYAVGPGAQVQVQSRSIDARTVPPPKPVTTKEKVKLAVLGLVFAAVFFGIAMLFPPVREKFAEFIGAIKPVNIEGVPVRDDLFKAWFTAAKDEEASSSRVLVLKLTRTKAYPLTQESLEAAYAKADTLAAKLALEAIARGYVRIELVDSEGVTFSSMEFRIRDLEKKESIELKVPLIAGEKKRQLERIDIRY